MPRPINQDGLYLVREFEGFSAVAYRCPAGVWTIGYGHTKDVKQGDRISVDDAIKLLVQDLNDAGEHVERLIHVPLGENQYAALCSFTLNVGPTALIESTLREKLNQGDYDAVPEQLMRWTKATVDGRKVVLPGLVRRRAAEVALWLKDSPSAGTIPPGEVSV